MCGSGLIRGSDGPETVDLSEARVRVLNWDGGGEAEGSEEEEGDSEGEWRKRREKGGSGSAGRE